MEDLIAEFGGYRLFVFPDDDAENPRRGDDNACRIVLWRDLAEYGDRVVAPQDLAEEWAREGVPPVAYTLVADGEGGLMMADAVSDIASGPGDGVVYVTEADLRKRLGAKAEASWAPSWAEDTMEAEVFALSQWLCGEVYCYCIVKGDCELVTMRGGYLYHRSG